MLRAIAWGLGLVLLACAAYELALALGAGSIGNEPGDGPAASDAVWFAALLAMLAGVIVAALLGASPSVAAALLAPAAAAFLVAFFFTYDPYFAPTLRRYSEGAVSPAWIVVVGVVALAAGLLALARPRVGAIVTCLVLVLLIGTTVVAGDGH